MQVSSDISLLIGGVAIIDSDVDASAVEGSTDVGAVHDDPAADGGAGEPELRAVSVDSELARLVPEAAKSMAC